MCLFASPLTSCFAAPVPTSDESQFLRNDLFFFGHCLHVLDHSEPGTQKVSSTFLAFAYGKPLCPLVFLKQLSFLFSLAMKRIF